MSLLKVLRDQSAIGFDGRVVIQGKENSNQVGEIFLSSGEIVGCSFNKITGLRAFIDLFVHELVFNNDFKFVVEPELINQESFQFRESILALESRIREVVEKTEQCKKLKPPLSKKMIINPDFICRGKPIEPLEFDLLCILSDYSKVEDIYKNSSYLEYQITNALVSLRKKGALKVIN